MDNRSDDTCKEIGKHSDLDGLYWAVFQVVFPILIVLGVFSNIVNLIVLTRPRMMNKIYRWLRTLAVVDIALCILTVPVCIANSGHTPTSHTLAMYYSMFGWSLSIGSQIVSFYLMVWFAYDRYLAVCRHHKYPKSLGYEVYRNRVVATILCVLILYIPTMAVGTTCGTENGWFPSDGYRHITNHWYKAYTYFREIISRIVPAGLMTVFNIKIAMRLKQLRDIRDSFANGVSPERREKERRLVVLLFWVTALFYVYNSPVAIYYVVFLNHNIVDKENEDQVLTFGVISNLIQMIGNVSNFTLYFLINPEYRKTLKDLFCCRKPGVLDDPEITQSQQTPPRSQNRIKSMISNANTADDLSDLGFHVGPAGTDKPDSNFETK